MQNYNSKSTILHIDTTSNEQIIVALIVDNKKFEKKEKIGKQKSQIVLPMLENLLKEHGLQLKDLTGIEVNPGPGSFTGIRVGISIAQALAHSLNIPINGKKGEFVEPKYQ